MGSNDAVGGRRTPTPFLSGFIATNRRLTSEHGASAFDRSSWSISGRAALVQGVEGGHDALFDAGDRAGRGIHPRRSRLTVTTLLPTDRKFPRSAHKCIGGHGHAKTQERQWSAFAVSLRQ